MRIKIKMAQDDKPAQEQKKDEKKSASKHGNFHYSYKKRGKILYIAAIVVIVALGAAFMFVSSPRINANLTDTSEPPAAMPSLNESTVPVINESSQEPTGGLSGTTVEPPPLPQENATQAETNQSNETAAPETSPPLPPVATVPSSIGLTAVYFSTNNLGGSETSPVIAPIINLIWSASNPPPEGISPTKFSARFTGKIQIPQDGKYTFIVTSDDGSRLFIDNVNSADVWNTATGSITASTTKNLTAGTHDIKIEYRNIGGAAKLKLEYLSSTLNITRQIVPSEMLLPQ
jgi:mannan endo-1,4-beta-mannosidase